MNEKLQEEVNTLSELEYEDVLIHKQYSGNKLKELIQDIDKVVENVKRIKKLETDK